MPDEEPGSKDPIRSELVRDDASFSKIVLEFVEGLSDRLASMESAILDSDFEALRAAAHQLKGSGGGYGYPILTERASELEQLAKSQIRDECVQSVDELKQLCGRVAQGLE